MITNTSVPGFAIEAIDGEFSIHRLPAGTHLPVEVLNEPLFAIVKSDQETSVLCPAEFVMDAQKTEGPFRGMRVAGQLDFSLTGLLRDITATLAGIDIPVFVVSSFDTDYIFVPAPRHESALRALGAPVELPGQDSR